MNGKRMTTVLLAVMGWAAPVSAQTVYRCGDSYSQAPCPGSSVVDVNDARSAGQRAQTHQAAQRDAKAADALEKERLKDEARPAQVHVTPARAQASAEAKAIAAKAKDNKPTKPAQFTAVSPAKPKADKPKKKSAS